mmetsp:Transcript_32310/g.69160  ORF Transcript_32310/g.69160 Transcript_32310/m.69160 type:complete len:98 (+) Transcript_32310:118-411(+)
MCGNFRIYETKQVERWHWQATHALPMHRNNCQTFNIHYEVLLSRLLQPRQPTGGLKPELSMKSYNTFDGPSMETPVWHNIVLVFSRTGAATSHSPAK